LSPASIYILPHYAACRMRPRSDLAAACDVRCAGLYLDHSYQHVHHCTYHNTHCTAARHQETTAMFLGDAHSWETPQDTRHICQVATHNICMCTCLQSVTPTTGEPPPSPRLEDRNQEDGARAYYFFFFAVRGGVDGRAVSAPPMGNFCLRSVGFRIWNEHMSVSSTDIMAPALSNSPQ